MHNTPRLLREFIRSPRQVGAIMPSSERLASQIVSDIQLKQANLILEFGAGTGVFTRHILRDMKPDATFWAFEINPRLVVDLRLRFPRAVIQDISAESAPELLKRQNLPQADCIVSGLPWASFNTDLQQRLLDATRQALKPGGCFATFAYLQGAMMPAGCRFSRQLQQTFGRVHRSAVVWRNLPPAFVYRCYA